MASRLSQLSDESLLAVYDSGHQSFALTKESREDGPIVPIGKGLDLNALLLAQDPEAAVQQVPPQQLFHALKLQGPEDHLEVLRCMSQDQVVRLLDYDAWSHDHLDLLKAIGWLELFGESGPEQLYTRFRELDEEYQLALLGPMIKVYDLEEFEALSEGRQDQMHPLPCGTLYFSVESQDPRIIQFIESLVEAGLANDLNYTYSLLTHAAYLPPNEQESLISQMRRARLEEDGYLPLAEAQTYFAPLGPKDLAMLKELGAYTDSPFSLSLESGSPVVPKESFSLEVSEANAVPLSFLRRVLQAIEKDSNLLDELRQGLLTLANGLCAATNMEPDDLRGLELLMRQGQGQVSLGLEWLSAGKIDQAIHLMRKLNPKMLFRAGLTLVRRLGDDLTLGLVKGKVRGSDIVQGYWQRGKFGSLIQAVDRELFPWLGLERAEVLKGILNRFPMRMVAVKQSQDVESDTITSRYTFVPVDSLESLRELAQTSTQIMALIYLVYLAMNEGEYGTKTLDQILEYGSRAVLSGNGFDPGQGQFAKLPDHLPLLQGRREEFLKGIEGTLQLCLAPGAPSSCQWWLIGPKIQPAKLVTSIMSMLAEAMDRIAAHKGGFL